MRVVDLLHGFQIRLKKTIQSQKMPNKVLCLWIDCPYLQNDQLLELLTTDDNKNRSP